MSSQVAYLASNEQIFCNNAEKKTVCKKYTVYSKNPNICCVFQGMQCNSLILSCIVLAHNFELVSLHCTWDSGLCIEMSMAFRTPGHLFCYIFITDAVNLSVCVLHLRPLNGYPLIIVFGYQLGSSDMVAVDYPNEVSWCMDL